MLQLLYVLCWKESTANILNRKIRTAGSNPSLQESSDLLTNKHSRCNHKIALCMQRPSQCQRTGSIFWRSDFRLPCVSTLQGHMVFQTQPLHFRRQREVCPGANGKQDTEQSTGGVSLLSFATVDIKEHPFTPDMPHCWSGSRWWELFPFLSRLLSFGSIKFHPLSKTHLGAFVGDTNPFLPSYRVTAISQQATEKKVC